MLDFFPENYTWSLSVHRCLSAGGQINEVDEACVPLRELSKQNDETAQNAWHESWNKLAKRVEELAIHDEEAGHFLSAGRKYLRACMYYFAAESTVNNHDPRKLETYQKVLTTFKKGIQLSRHPVEYVEVPFGKSSLPGFFVSAPGSGPAPCLIFFDGFDGCKELNYLLTGQEFRSRGIALLTVDTPGVGEALRLRNMPLDIQTEHAASACVDYLESRADIDSEHIGIMGISMGGYYAPRAAAFEKRLKCCVGWGPWWSRRDQIAYRMSLPGKPQQRSVFELLWVTGKRTVEEASRFMEMATLEGVADKITCPLLVVAGEHDLVVPPSSGEKLISAAVNSPVRKLKMFTRAEGGIEHVQVDNITLAVDYIADWLAETLGGNPKGV